MSEGRSHPCIKGGAGSDSPPEEEGICGQPRRRRIRTRHIAYAALAIAIGHVIYAILRDHVFHASPILQ